MAKVSPDIDNATLISQLNKYEQYILSLEVALQNASKSNAINRNNYLKKQETIHQLRARIAHLHLIFSENNKEDEQSDLGLPDIDRCTVEELIICDKFMTERLQFCKDLYSNLLRIYSWLTKASQGKGFILSSIFRLSKISKIMRNLDNETKKLAKDEQDLSEKSDKLLAKIRYKFNQNYTDVYSKIQALIKLFQDLDAISTRIAKVRSIVMKEERKLDRMRTWLDTNEKSMPTFSVATVPSLEDTEKAEKEIKSSEMNTVLKSKDRLDIARKFVESCILDSSSQIQGVKLETKETKKKLPRRRVVKGATISKGM